MRPTRREFLTCAGRLAGAAWPTRLFDGPLFRSRTQIPARELRADLVVIGGGLGGCAAALAAAERGLRVIVTEETAWIGGQLTAQAVPLDENAWIDKGAGSRTYQALRQRIRAYYTRNYPLSAEARVHPRFNPGNGAVSSLCHEPRVGLAALEEMLAPWVASQRIRILVGYRAHTAATNRDRVDAVTIRARDSARDLVLHAPFYVDATELGDLLPLTGTEYITGAESRRSTGEPHAAAEANPHNQQAFTCCFAMDYLHGEDHVIDRPAEYGFWRDHVPPLRPPWPGRLLSLVYSQPRTLQPFNMGFDPSQGTGLFRYRRIIDRTNFAPGTYAGDLTLVNWPQNDYMLGNLIDVPADQVVPSDVSGREAGDHFLRPAQVSRRAS